MPTPSAFRSSAGTSGRVVLVDLGRRTASGARRRVKNLTEVLSSMGLQVRMVEVLPEYRSTRWNAMTRLPALVGGSDTVPETLAWSPAMVRRELERLDPSIVVCITDRCFHPALLGPWRTYIDFVDRLSVSYAGRSRIVDHPVRRAGYRALSHPHRRFERSLPLGVAGAFAAGRADAAALGVDWVLINASPDPRPLDELRVAADHDTDLAFVGTLDYPPNEAAVQQLDTLWPALRDRRPGISALIAGARPTTQVRELARRNEWELIPDFSSAAEVFARCRVAVAPLEHASGLQIKVLDAAANAVPQVVTKVVASGLDPGFPLLSADDSHGWVSAVFSLLDDPNTSRALGERSRRHLAINYSVTAAAHQVRRALGLQDNDS